jgi:hypothetical protein
MPWALFASNNLPAHCIWIFFSAPTQYNVDPDELPSSPTDEEQQEGRVYNEWVGRSYRKTAANFNGDLIGVLAADEGIDRHVVLRYLVQRLWNLSEYAEDIAQEVADKINGFQDGNYKVNATEVTNCMAWT